MGNFKKYLFFFVMTGWTIGIVFHILSIADIRFANEIPYFVLHAGMFVGFVPSIIEVLSNEEIQQYNKLHKGKLKNPFTMYRMIFKKAPVWLIIIFVGGFVYALLNMFFFADAQTGSPMEENGKYILQNHGTIIKTITEREYYHYKANTVRIFSGIWLVFYSFSACILYPFSSTLIQKEN